MTAKKLKFWPTTAGDSEFTALSVYRDWFAGEGERFLKAGHLVYHPPRHIHDFMEYSEDIELLKLSFPKICASIDV